MGYVAVTGGQKAIEGAEKLVHLYRLQAAKQALPTEEIRSQMRLLIDRVMGEGGLYAPGYASLALKQAEGDPSEAAFLLRAYRSTLPRNHYSLTVEPGNMRVIRRISSAFKDIPGGQLLGPTYDYTHRLLNFELRQEDQQAIISFLQELEIDIESEETLDSFPKVVELLKDQKLMADRQAVEDEPFDVTREKLSFPLPRSARLQLLARGETGAMTAFAYSSMRGYGAVHPTIGELRVGYTDVYIPYPYGSGKDEEDSIYIGEMLLTEVETINSFTQNDQGDVEFMLGYGLTMGQNEVKAISMAILERSLDTQGHSPTQDEEFVLLHIDSVEAHGFVSHLKMPHYITFQSSLDRIRQAQNTGKHQAQNVGKDEQHVSAD
ncbi:carbon-phosphorus lyase complex subunit PhnI [Bacillus horti]|uniref:Alpha-D-ribose 1-methylphosphonate 5-triphosphate synthase subunit PhnI n=2 Tax=Caldalkalibacillus horti TaxID=77523 RepID=A0ABT9W2I1_9BACI|nr:carbon-phosphorus lyase complex subunit PhnI [Bacillus horti]MDQ0167040.1 alpha-D-ribose 1-methylphosphonate 5-triphosphate synthase subunit PhnI [Bacillus horti]